MPRKVEGPPARYLTLALMVVCCLAPTIQSYHLRKIYSINGQISVPNREAKHYQEGKVLFGNFFEKGAGDLPSSLTVNAGRTTHSSTGGESSYQADSAGKLTLLFEVG